MSMRTQNPHSNSRLRGRLRRLLVAAAAVGALAVFATPATAQTFVPTADSYVNASLATSNFGTSTVVKVDGSPVLRAYMKFNLTGVGTPASAALRIYVNTSDHPGFQIRGVPDTSWGESTMTYNNAPAFGSVVSSSGTISTAGWYTIDISSLVTGDGPMSLAITTESSKSVSISSRESGRAPQLVIPAPPSPSPFEIRSQDTGWVAESLSAGTVYSGSLKSVVESAVSDLNRAGGGTVRFLAGDYDLGNSQWEFHGIAGITFEGQGIDVTTIRNNMSSTTFDTEPFDFSTADRTVIRDMTVIAGGPLRTTSDAIDFDGGNNSIIERVKITGSRARGIVFDGKDVVGGLKRTADHNIVRDCIIEGVPGDGIEFLASSFNRVENCTITNVGLHGIQMAKASTTAGQPNKKSVDNVITGNVIDNAGQDGINITSGDRNEINGNTITNSADDTSGRDGIRVMATNSQTCDDNVISNTTSTDNQPVKTQRYGVAITSTLCHRTLVFSNNLEGNRLGPILDGGTDTQVTPPTADTEPPTAPSNLVATATAFNRIDLSWSSATDNVAVAGYRITRDGAVIATVPSSMLSYADTGVISSTTYTYFVEALDAAGNVSPPSAPTSAMTPAGPSILTLTPIADAYVNEASVASNYGLSTTLRVDGSPIVTSYLRFDVELPAGRSAADIQSAKLVVFANTSSSVGHDMRGVADNSWGETTINFTNAPPAGAVAGSSGPFAGGTFVESDVTSLITGSGLLSLAMTGPGSTAISYASRESTNPPQLVIEFSS